MAQSTEMNTEDQPMASDKIDALIRALEYLIGESHDETLSTQEILDIDQMYNIIEGRGYDD